MSTQSTPGSWIAVAGERSSWELAWNDKFPPLNLWNYNLMNVNNSNATGLRYNEGKNPLELLDPQALEGLARVLEFGASKYSANNWRGGLKYSSLIGCLMRHLFAIMRGEDIDKESGLPHIDHVGCNWMFLSYMMKNRLDLDDRYKAK